MGADNPKNDKALLKIKGLEIGYPQKKDFLVAAGIDLSINESELVAVIGVNGAGKSTLLKTLSKNLPPLKGSILLNDISIEDYSAKQFSEVVSLVLTEHSFSKNLSVFELVALGRQPYTNWLGTLAPKDTEAVNQALEQTGTVELAEKKCDELSDGQLQKVLIARALAQDTSLVFMDEPTTHLDMYHKVYILRLLKNLVKSTGKAIVFATHEINLALQLCDKIILINSAKTHQGSPEELIEKGVFKDLFSADFIRFDVENKGFRVVG
jgi:iron complex transport system ATP-binding protein